MPVSLCAPPIRSASPARLLSSAAPSSPRPAALALAPQRLLAVAVPWPDGVALDGDTDALAERVARAAPEARAPREAAPERATAGLEAALPSWLPEAKAEAEAEPETVAVAVGRGVCAPGPVAGLIVATESIAPATRQTARMLASSGMTDPRAANGAVRRRILVRRRLARSSR